MPLDPNSVPEDSLIKEYQVLQSDTKMYKHKIIFKTVKDIELNYHTNSDNFIKTLEEFNGDTFVITYHYAEHTDKKSKEPNSRIVRVKLPKTQS